MKCCAGAKREGREVGRGSEARLRRGRTTSFFRGHLLLPT